MVRRGRLALRQVEQPVGLDEEKGNAQAAIATHQSTADASVDSNAMERETKRRKKEDALAKAESSKDSRNPIWNLYQDGIDSKSVLQLAYVRRRAPKLSKRPIAEQFLVPRPSLHVDDFLPPTDYSETATTLPASTPTSTVEHDQALSNANAFFHKMEQASETDRQAWKQLNYEDWMQIYETHHSKAPSPTLLVELLEQAPSSELCIVTWEAWLLPLLERTSQMDSSTSITTAKRIVECLVTHHPRLGKLQPKDYRAQIRALHLRDNLPETFGAIVESQFIELYRQLRHLSVISSS